MLPSRAFLRFSSRCKDRIFHLPLHHHFGAVLPIVTNHFWQHYLFMWIRLNKWGLIQPNQKIFLKTEQPASWMLTGLPLWVGGELLSHTSAVSSSRRGLTSLFGMGRGAPPRHSRHLFVYGLGGWVKTDTERHWAEAFGQLVPLGSTCRHAPTCGLSTW